MYGLVHTLTESSQEFAKLSLYLDNRMSALDESISNKDQFMNQVNEKDNELENLRENWRQAKDQATQLKQVNDELQEFFDEKNKRISRDS